MATDAQLFLIPGHYRCDRCRRDVTAVSRHKGWRLCPRCVAAVVPSCDPLRGGDGKVRTEAERREVERYWGWYWRRREHKPKKYSAPYKRPKPDPHADSYFPLCDCGRPREAFNLRSRPAGLFGGPFHHQCPTCEARAMVESLVTPAWLGGHPDWDDEDWLDHLWRAFPKAFEVGVLPDYWYELRQRLAATE